MNRLFAKIFIAFWVTTIAVVVATAFVTMQINRSLRDNPLQAHFIRTQAAYAEAAASILDSQGLDELILWMDELHGPGGVRGHLQLLGDDGTAVFGSPAARDIAAALAAQHSGVSSPDVIDGVYFDPLYGPDGERYWFVSDMRRKPKFGPILRNPAHKRGSVGIRVAIALLISGLICYVLARYLTIPIRRLQAASAEISSGNFKIRVDSDQRNDELGDLGRDFNRMAEQLERLEASQEQLIRDVSHELRSPLARLEIALGLARKRAPENLDAELDRIEREARSLEDLIGQLLSISRIESGVVESMEEQVSIDELVDEIASDANYEGANARKSVTVVGRTELHLHGDRSLLKSAIENVVRNALTHTPADSVVNISLEHLQNQDQIAIRVDDNGPGVPGDRIEELFKPFVRGDFSRTREFGGFGIGLAIADSAIRHHGGTISGRNRSSGGFRVEICLPTLKS